MAETKSWYDGYRFREFGYDAKTGEAFIPNREIRRKRYAKAPEGYEGEILFAGISYDRKDKRHSCQTETQPAHAPAVETPRFLHPFEAI